MFLPSRERFTSPVLRAGEFRPGTLDEHRDEVFVADGCYLEFPRTAAWIHREGGRRFVADANAVVIYNEGTRYRRRGLVNGSYRSDWIGIAPGLIRSFVGWEMAALSPELYLKQRELFAAARHGSDSGWLKHELLQLVIDVLDCDTTSHADHPAHRDLVEEARAWLNQRFTSSQGLSELAGGLGISMFHLCRIFRRHTGITIHQYRHQLRMRASLEQLERAGDDIVSVALDLGYSGHSHFTSAFRRCFGQTPSVFRNAHSAVSVRPSVTSTTTASAC